jgi:hypothetical protein
VRRPSAGYVYCNAACVGVAPPPVCVCCDAACVCVTPHLSARAAMRLAGAPPLICLLSNKNFDVVSISHVQRVSYLYIVPIYRRFFFDIEVTYFDIEGGKQRLLEHPQYRKRYRKRYRCIYMISSSKTGPSVPHPPSRDSSEEREMDFDDHRDYMDRDFCCSSLLPILDQFLILEWFARSDEHQSRRTSTWLWRGFPFLCKDRFHKEYHRKRPFR